MSNAIKHNTLEFFLYNELTIYYKVINVDGFEGPLSFLRIFNGMDVPVIISFDGQHRHEYIGTGEQIEISAQRCSSVPNNKCLFKNKTRVYAKRANGAATAGSLYVTGVYQN